MTIDGGCKINLGLNIIRRRTDGYHDIESLFIPVALCDSISIMPSKELKHTLTIHGIDIEGDIEQNLVLRAARLVNTPPVDILLQKNIPTGAGLGGGSSDAATTLVALNKMFGLSLTDAQMEKMVSSIGADCAFFVKNKPQFAQGIGNEFSPVDMKRLNGMKIIILKPNVFISTREAYAGVKPRKPDVCILDAIKQPISEWKHLLRNDFEDNILVYHPQIAQAKHILYESGAVYAQMSGSGAAVFGLYYDETKIPNIPSDWFVWCGNMQF